MDKGALHLPLHPSVQEGLEKSTKLLQSLGHIVEPFTFDIDGVQFFKSYFILFGEKMKLLIKAVEQSTGQKAEASKLLEPWTIKMARNLEQYTATDKQNALAYITQLKREVSAVFLNYDLLMSPVMAMMPPDIGDLKLDQPYTALYEKNISYMEYTALQNMSSSTAMSIPLYWTAENMPIGIHFAASIGQENRLFELAFELEAAQPWKDKRPVLD